MTPVRCGLAENVQRSSSSADMALLCVMCLRVRVHLPFGPGGGGGALSVSVFLTSISVLEDQSGRNGTNTWRGMPPPPPTHHSTGSRCIPRGK